MMDSPDGRPEMPVSCVVPIACGDGATILHVPLLISGFGFLLIVRTERIVTIPSSTRCVEGG